MAKQYAEPATYEAKLEKVMSRLGVEQYDYNSTWVAGMKYLPAGKDIPVCFQILQFTEIPEGVTEVDKQFKRLVKIAHPDAGGSEEQFRALQTAREMAIEYFKKEGE